MWLFTKSIFRHTLSTKYKIIFSEIHLKTIKSYKSLCLTRTKNPTEEPKLLQKFLKTITPAE